MIQTRLKNPYPKRHVYASKNHTLKFELRTTNKADEAHSVKALRPNIFAFTDVIEFFAEKKWHALQDSNL